MDREFVGRWREQNSKMVRVVESHPNVAESATLGWGSDCAFVKTVVGRRQKPNLAGYARGIPFGQQIQIEDFRFQIHRAYELSRG